MRRGFGYDEDDENWGTNSWGTDDFEDADEEMERAMEPNMLDMMQFDLESMHLNTTLLGTVMRMLEQSWTWKFRSPQTKLRLVREAYKALSDLVQSEGDLPQQKE